LKRWLEKLQQKDAAANVVKEQFPVALLQAQGKRMMELDRLEVELALLEQENRARLEILLLHAENARLVTHAGNNLLKTAFLETGQGMGV
jgi:hypothetical protein